MKTKLFKILTLAMVMVFVLAAFSGCTKDNQGKGSSTSEQPKEKTSQEVFNALKSGVKDANALDVSLDMSVAGEVAGEKTNAALTLGFKSDFEKKNVALTLDYSMLPEEVLAQVTPMLDMLGFNTASAKKEVSAVLVDKVLYAEAFGEKVKQALTDEDLNFEDLDINEIFGKMFPAGVEIPDVDVKSENAELEKYILSLAKIETVGTDSILTITMNKEDIIKVVELSGDDSAAASVEAFKKLEGTFQVVAAVTVDKDNVLKSINASFKIAAEQDGQKIDVDASFKFTVNSIGKAVTITAPADPESYQDLETFISENETLSAMLAGQGMAA